MIGSEEKTLWKSNFLKSSWNPLGFVLSWGGLVVFCYWSFGEYMYIEFSWDEWSRSCPRAGISPISEKWSMLYQPGVPAVSPKLYAPFECLFLMSHHLSHLNMMVGKQWFPSWTISQSQLKKMAEESMWIKDSTNHIGLQYCVYGWHLVVWVSICTG